MLLYMSGRGILNRIRGAMSRFRASAPTPAPAAPTPAPAAQVENPLVISSAAARASTAPARASSAPARASSARARARARASRGPNRTKSIRERNIGNNRAALGTPGNAKGSVWDAVSRSGLRPGTRPKHGTALMPRGNTRNYNFGNNLSRRHRPFTEGVPFGKQNMREDDLLALLAHPAPRGKHGAEKLQTATEVVAHPATRVRRREGEGEAWDRWESMRNMLGQNRQMRRSAISNSKRRYGNPGGARASGSRSRSRGSRSRSRGSRSRSRSRSRGSRS